MTLPDEPFAIDPGVLTVVGSRPMGEHHPRIVCSACGGPRIVKSWQSEGSIPPGIERVKAECEPHSCVEITVRGASPRGLIRDPVPDTRLTDEQLAEMEALIESNGRIWNPAQGRGGPEAALPVFVELRRLRALLADLKAEGCPWKVDGCRGCEDNLPHGSDGQHYFEIAPPIVWGPHFAGKVRQCVFCGGPVIDEPGEDLRYDHRPMEDGKPCLWVRIEGA